MQGTEKNETLFLGVWDRSRPVHPPVQNSVVLAMVFSNFKELSVIYVSFSVIFVDFQ